MAFDPWETGSPLYRRLLLIGMAVTALGIILAIIGAVTSTLPISWTGIAVLLIGIGIHLAAQWVRFFQARKKITEKDR